MTPSSGESIRLAALRIMRRAPKSRGSEYHGAESKSATVPFKRLILRVDPRGVRPMVANTGPPTFWRSRYSSTPKPAGQFTQIECKS